MEDKIKYCKYCGRKLKSQASRDRGFGLVCYKRYLESMNKGGLFEEIEKRKNVHSNPDKTISE